MPRCNATARTGKRCRRPAAAGADLCTLHLKAEQPPASPDMVERLVQMFRSGSPVKVATAAIGIHPRTFEKWVARGRDQEQGPYRDFADRVDQARAEGEATRVAQVARAGADDWRAAAWMLERGDPDQWGRSPRLIDAGDAGDAPTQAPAAARPPSVRRAIREARATLTAIGEEPALSRGAVERYATAVAAWRTLEAEWARLGRPGVTYGGATGAALVAHPLIALIAAARREAAYLGSLLGLDPQARLRLSRKVGAGRPAGAASAPDRAVPPPVRTLRSVS